jgi:nuclear pore complex protein Nup205
VLALADEVDIDELEAARYILESRGDETILGRSLLECAIIRFHQQRKYALDALRLLLELDSGDDENGDDDDDRDGEPISLEAIQVYLFERIFNAAPGTAGPGQRLVPRCMASMQAIKTWLQNLNDKITAAQTLGQSGAGPLSEEAETIEYSRVSLIQEHELLAVILCRSVGKQQAVVSDFTDFISNLRRVDRYDNLLGLFCRIDFTSMSINTLSQSTSYPLLARTLPRSVPSMGAMTSAGSGS